MKYLNIIAEAELTIIVIAFCFVENVYYLLHEIDFMEIFLVPLERLVGNCFVYMVPGAC